MGGHLPLEEGPRRRAAQAGASGSIGTESATRAAPDGYTVLYGSVGALVVQPLLHPKLRYDPVRDFRPVHGLGTSPNMLVVPTSRPWRTVAELVGSARAKPDALNHGSAGIGTSLHLCGALLQTDAGIRMNRVPYVNYSQLINDLIAGRLDCVFDYPLTAMPHVREGRLRALGVTDTRRAPIAPEVPTMAEAGSPAVELSSWSGLFLPARTPEPIVTAMATATAQALRDPKVVEFFNGSAIELWPEVGPDRLRALLFTEIVRIRELLERSGATSS